MIKESIICIVSIITIVIGNFITQNYEHDSIDNIIGELDEMKTQILKNEDKKNLQNKADSIDKEWNSKNSKLAYFLEHGELEKIETSCTKLRANIETENYQDALIETEETIYLLKHLENKDSLKLENIF